MLAILNVSNTNNAVMIRISADESSFLLSQAALLNVAVFIWAQMHTENRNTLPHLPW